ncbi:MAG: response regulator [Eubacterium sp.]|nr:response regulator [Eubacterium sp.]
MYRIMLADDEGIVIDSLRMIIERAYGDECEVMSAKTGREVITLAEQFRPDIAFMDIQMPGINGIDAMREIQRVNPEVIFIVVSAYDRFDYAKESISLGVMDYLNKPFDRKTILDVLSRAINQIDKEREARRISLKIREEIETVYPLIESSFIYSVLFQENFDTNLERYRDLLGIQSSYGYMLVIACSLQKSQPVSGLPVEAGIILQENEAKIRELVKNHMPCLAGPMISGKITCFLETDAEHFDYNQRTDVIERARQLRETLQDAFAGGFRIGIGTVKPLPELEESYREALGALRITDAGVAHAKDVKSDIRFAENYPIETEKQLFHAIEQGDAENSRKYAKQFFKWMETNYAEALMDIRVKILEFVLRAELMAHQAVGLTYYFMSRSSYLPDVMNTNDLGALESWFVSHILQTADYIADKRRRENANLVSRVRNRVDNEYSDPDLSLEGISRDEDVSFYYLSRLFKEKTGETFMEYLTGRRLGRAKELMIQTNKPMREICLEVGYTDPNYFSRIFKKNVGKTPTEFRGEVQP